MTGLAIQSVVNSVTERRAVETAASTGGPGSLGNRTRPSRRNDLRSVRQGARPMPLIQTFDKQGNLRMGQRQRPAMGHQPMLLVSDEADR